MADDKPTKADETPTKADDKPKMLADDEIPYQQRPAVAQMRGELANAVAYGQDDRVKSLRRRFAEMGVAEEATPEKAAETRKAAAEEKPAAKAEPPAERATPQQHKHVATTPTKPTGRS